MFSPQMPSVLGYGRIDLNHFQLIQYYRAGLQNLTTMQGTTSGLPACSCGDSLIILDEDVALSEKPRGNPSNI